MRIFSFAALVAMILAGPVLAQKSSADLVMVSTKADKPDADGKQSVTITIAIEKDWHLYANPVGNDMLKAAQTTLKAVGKAEIVKVDYPAGKLVKDEIVGDYKTYEGTVVIRAVVRRSADETGPLTLTVRLQACNDIEKKCLVPGAVKVEVP